LARGEVQFFVGNGARVAAIAVGTFPLTLPSGMVLELSKCYYVPVIKKNHLCVMFGHRELCVQYKEQVLFILSE